MGKPAGALRLNDTQKELLDHWANSPGSRSRIRSRAQIGLLAAKGLSDLQISRRLHVSRPTVAFWRAAIRDRGVEAIVRQCHTYNEKAREQRREIRSATLRLQRTTQRAVSTRQVAHACGVSHATVARAWGAEGMLKPRLGVHDFDFFEQFFLRVAEVVGIYITPAFRSVFVALSRLVAGRLTQFGFDPGRNLFKLGWEELGFVSCLEAMEARAIKDAGAWHERTGDFTRYLRDLDRKLPVSLALVGVCDCYSPLEHRLRCWFETRSFPLFRAQTREQWYRLVCMVLDFAGEEAGDRFKFKSLRLLVDHIRATLNDTKSPVAVAGFRMDLGGESRDAPE